MKHIKSASIEHPGFLALHFHDGGVAELGQTGGEYWRSEELRMSGAPPDKSAEWSISKLSASAAIIAFRTDHVGGNVRVDSLRMLSRHFILVTDEQVLIYENSPQHPPIGELEIYV